MMEAGEKARVMLQSPFHGGRLLSVVMRGLRFVNAGQGVPSTEDLMLVSLHQVVTISI